LTRETGRHAKVTNPAVGGFTTLNLIDRELPLMRRLKPDLVTILIGVNDLVQGRTPTDYRASLVTIYDEVQAQKPQDGRVFAISLPNWSVVPAARQFGDPEEIRDLTDTFNDIAREEAETRGFKWIDITAASLSGLGSPDWIASDGLHPADRQYAAWAEVIWFHIGATGR
jgi:acyl-CoA thioesterase-1